MFAYHHHYLFYRTKAAETARWLDEAKREADQFATQQSLETRDLLKCVSSPLNELLKTLEQHTGEVRNLVCLSMVFKYWRSWFYYSTCILKGHIAWCFKEHHNVESGAVL